MILRSTRPRRWIAESTDPWWQVVLIAMAVPGLFALAGAGAYLIVAENAAPWAAVLGLVAVGAAAATASHLAAINRPGEVRLG